MAAPGDFKYMEVKDEQTGIWTVLCCEGRYKPPCNMERAKQEVTE